MRAVPYLTFAGNARQGMLFYKKCLGGKLELQKLGDSPLGKDMPAKMKKAILHATLTKKEFVIMASDMANENGLIKGSTVSIMLDCESEKEIKNIYKKLSLGGKLLHPIEITFFGSMIGALIDKFGNNWLLHYKIKNPGR